jgi:hypothetical protein
MSDVEKLGIDKVAEIALEIAWKDANCEKSILVICPTEASAAWMKLSEVTIRWYFDLASSLVSPRNG